MRYQGYSIPATFVMLIHDPFHRISFPLEYAVRNSIHKVVGVRSSAEHAFGPTWPLWIVPEISRSAHDTLNVGPFAPMAVVQPRCRTDPKPSDQKWPRW